MIVGKYSGSIYPRAKTHVPRVKKASPVAVVLCSNCQLNPIRYLDTCSTCGDYLRTHGVERPAYLIERARRRKTNPRWCCNCGRTKIYKTGRCEACYKYQLRTGRERDALLWSDEIVCSVCQYPKAALKPDRHGRCNFVRGRCIRCYGYYIANGRERPARLHGTGKYGWCECGYPAEHKAGGFNLCNLCVKEMG